MGIVNESFFDKSRLLQGTSTVEARYINYPVHEDAAELNQVNQTLCMILTYDVYLATER